MQSIEIDQANEELATNKSVRRHSIARSEERWYDRYDEWDEPYYEEY